MTHQQQRRRTAIGKEVIALVAIIVIVVAVVGYVSIPKSIQTATNTQTISGVSSSFSLSLSTRATTTSTLSSSASSSASSSTSTSGQISFSVISETSSSSSVGSSTTTALKTTTCGVAIGNSSDVCAVLLSYAQLQQLVAHSTSIRHENGTIFLTVGSPGCTFFYYFLPNSTYVQVQTGSPGTSTASCT